MSQCLQALGFGLGTTELLIILGILLFIFGAGRIPELGKSLGSGIRGFQKSLKGDEEQKQLEAEQNANANPAPNATREPARREATVMENSAPPTTSAADQQRPG